MKILSFLQEGRAGLAVQSGPEWLDVSRADPTLPTDVAVLLGDPQWQVPPGTPFTALPAHWTCPQCEGRADQFMVVDGR